MSMSALGHLVHDICTTFLMLLGVGFGVCLGMLVADFKYDKKELEDENRLHQEHMGS